MSSRFHNKWHRHNHHTEPIGDPRFPDASHDPIASPESPFRGAFHLLGPLSAYSSPLSSSYGAFITNNNIALQLKSNLVALSVIEGSINMGGAGNFFGNDIFGTGFYLYNNPTYNVTFGYSEYLPNTIQTNFNIVFGLLNTIQGSTTLSSTSIFNTIVGYRNNLYNAFESIALGNNLIVGSLTSTDTQQNSLALGNQAIVLGDRSAGIGTYIQTNADNSFIIGNGVDGANLLTNSQPNTIGLGISSTNPKVIITTSGVGIGIPNNGLPTTTLHVEGSAYISGNLIVDGAFTYLDTQVVVSSAMDIVNTGTGPALEVTQTGDNVVANFYDDTNSALFIDGRASAPGYVGINTENPNHRLTVVGTISSTDGVITSNATIGTTNISLSTVRTFSTPVTATGDFLVLTIDGQPKAIRLWNYL
jgi:hypothetical protein